MSKRILAAAMAAALAMAGCGSGDESTSGPRTLKLWHYEAPDSAMGAAWAEAITQFEATHPGVKVAFESKGFEQIQKTAPMVLNSGDAPDILEYNKGNATAGLLSKQGLLTDISDEVTKRGWDKQLGAGIQTTARYDERGVMGSGKWYGIPNYAEYVMIFYNKDMFTQQGLAPPQTFEQLTAAMAKFADAGVTPLAVGGAEYPAHQILYQLALTKANRDWVDRYQRYTGDVNFHDRAWSYSVETFAEWMREGYISKDSAGMKAEDMGIGFIQGKYPIMISGSWWYGRLAAGIKDFQWATTLWPGLTAGSAGNMWVIPKGAKNKDLAYDFIAITMSPQIQDKLRDAGGVPLVKTDTVATAGPQIAEVAGNFTKLATEDRLAYYPDWPAPGYYDVLVSGVQKLITGSIQPHEMLTEIAKPYQENLANVGK